MTDLSKTFGFDVCQRDGRRVCVKTLTERSADTNAEVLKDIAQFFNDAGIAGASVKEKFPLCRLMGYFHELANAIEIAQALGVEFTATTDNGEVALSGRIDFQKLKLKAV